MDLARGGVLAGWDWVHWVPDAHGSRQAGVRELLSHLMIRNLFSSGKAVCCYDDSPDKIEAEVVKCLPEIPDQVLFVLVAPIARSSPIWKAAKELGDGFKVSEAGGALTKTSAVDWLQGRARDRWQASLDPEAAKWLVDKRGTDKNVLHMEAAKLVHFAGSKDVKLGEAREVLPDGGEAGINDFLARVMAGNAEAAHDLIGRLLDGGTSPEAVLAYMVKWSRKAAIAESLGRRVDGKSKERFAALAERPRKRKEKEEVPKGSEALAKEYSKARPRQQMFPNVGALYHTCRDLRGRCPRWGYALVTKARDMYLELRLGKADPRVLFFDFVEQACEGKRCQEKGN